MLWRYREKEVLKCSLLLMKRETSRIEKTWKDGMPRMVEAEYKDWQAMIELVEERIEELNIEEYGNPL